MTLKFQVVIIVPTCNNEQHIRKIRQTLNKINHCHKTIILSLNNTPSVNLSDNLSNS
jgi:hypothetical protein